MTLPDRDVPIREMPEHPLLPPFSPLFYDVRFARCTWCGSHFAEIDDVQLCLVCDRTVRP